MIRLSDTHLTLYAELLDLCTRAEAKASAGALPFGGFVSKEIRERRYWYLQVEVAGSKQQRYLGPESPALLARMKEAEQARRARAPDDELRSRLCAMLIAGGARSETLVLRIFALLAELGLFRRGAVLVGTHAFQAYGNLLGVRFEGEVLRTQDVDGVHDPSLTVAFAGERALQLERKLVDSDLKPLPIPELDVRLPSTSFSIRGRELRLDFLVPARGATSSKPVPIRSLGVAAQPLPFLDYLIEQPIPAVILGGKGVLVRVPDPARFALHKLWVARQRPANWQVRAQKDRHQAAALLRFLTEERPEDLARAWQATAKHPKPRKVIAGELAKLGVEVAALV